ncbi:MAG TPA: SDR family oxidoreductase [Thermoguttaceae bacterium]|nr:SDR family oxidoreductase [Thermoguttaceae bacterium]
MKRLLAFRITLGMAVRMIADAMMINFALLAALALRFLLHFAMHGQGSMVDYDKEFWEYVLAYCHSSWLLTPICLVVFSLSGFYTYRRAYQSRYKALIIFQAVAQSYLIFAFLTYFLWDRLHLTEIPRMALAMAFGINLALTLASRTWTYLWEQVVRPERDVQLRGNGGQMRNILVIGGAGYIGSALLPKLLEKGYHVRVLDRFIYGREPIQDLIGHSNLDLVEGDFCHVEKVVSAMQGMDAVVHLGAIVGDPACEIDHDVTLKVNLTATQMIAQVARASGIRRFVFASTCSVYGADDEILDERSEVKPISLYGKTKLAAERGLQGMADKAFVPTILRFGTIYGFSGRTRFDLVVNLLAAKAKVDGQITVYGGNQWRPFVHVDDAALAISQILNAPLALVGNETFNVGSDEQNYTIQQIGELVHKQVFTADLICEDSATDRRNYRVSFRKIRNCLGFRPTWTVEEGIRQVIEAIASGDVEDYHDPKYHNVKLLSESSTLEAIRTEEDWSHDLLESQASPEFAT